MGEIFHLVYISKPVGQVDDNFIKKILEKSHKNNLINNLTGLLIYRENIFIQLLEGDENKVLRLFNRISLDTRHAEIKILFKTKSDHRIYENWDMAYVNADKAKESAESILTLFEMVGENNNYDKSLILLLMKKILEETVSANL